MQTSSKYGLLYCSFDSRRTRDAYDIPYMVNIVKLIHTMLTL